MFLNIILLPILIPIWAVTLLFSFAVLPITILMKICGADVNLFPRFRLPFPTGSGSGGNAAEAPKRPMTSAEFGAGFRRD